MALLQAQELQVRSIAFDSPHGAEQKRVAFVRLMPPALPWRSAEQEVRCPGLLWAPPPQCHIMCQRMLLTGCSAAASPGESLALSESPELLLSPMLECSLSLCRFNHSEHLL